MLKSIHFLLTYQCLFECDHCFLYCGPHASGTFTMETIDKALRQGEEAGIDSIYVEGGEPFLYYPIMLETLRAAKMRGLETGLVTNCYWATSVADAEIWLKPLLEIGVDDLSFSDDAFHSDNPDDSLARNAFKASGNIGLPTRRICIEPPVVRSDSDRLKGEPVVDGDVALKGRAVEKLTADLPRRRYECFTECTQEELSAPARVHLDPFGNVFVCQGLSIGNINETPLAEIMRHYEPTEHPIVKPLLEGGPAELARVFGLPEGEEYVSDCHLCYLVRRKLLDRFPEYLCPKQVYGT